VLVSVVLAAISILALTTGFKADSETVPSRSPR